MSVKIMVDSTADLIPAAKERCTVVPLTVHFGDEEYIDGVTITHKQFYEKTHRERRCAHHQPGNACRLCRAV